MRDMRIPADDQRVGVEDVESHEHGNANKKTSEGERFRPPAEDRE
jgi:hypothetical protein